MQPEAIIEILRHGNQLKRTARTGWGQRGVLEAENVAAHSYGVAFTAMILAQLIEPPLDLGRVLAMAVLHDLPESLTSDIPTPAWRFLPAGIKTNVERQAMQEIFGRPPSQPALMALWEELHAEATPEAHLVHDADRLDMLLQAISYEQQSGNQRLAQFWAKPYSFHFAQSQAIYEALKSGRQQ